MISSPHRQFLLGVLPDLIWLARLVIDDMRARQCREDQYLFAEIIPFFRR